MRYVVGLVLVLVLMGSPLSVSAQAGEEPTSDPSAQESLPESAPEEAAVQLKLDGAGVEVASPGARFASAERAVERARRGMIGPSVVFGLGIGTLVASLAWAPHASCGDDDPATFDLCIPTGPIVLGLFGLIISTGGVIAMAVKGARLAKSKRTLRELQQAHHGTQRRAQWDLARSRLVF